MQVPARVEPVLSQVTFARQQAEMIRRSNGWPESGAAAYGAVATIRRLREVEIDLERYGAAVATALICTEHAYAAEWASES